MQRENNSAVEAGCAERRFAGIANRSPIRFTDHFEEIAMRSMRGVEIIHPAAHAINRGSSSNDREMRGLPPRRADDDVRIEI